MVMEEGIDAYLADNKFRKRDPTFAGAGRHKRPVARKKTKPGPRYFRSSDFILDKVKSKLICPAGKELYVKNRNFKGTDGHRGVSYMAKKTDRWVCECRKECLRMPHTEARQVVVFTGDGADGKRTYTQRMIEKFDTSLGRFLYSRRIGVAEPVFADITHALRLKWFSLRGRIKVNIQWKLFTIVHNIMKILRYGLRYAYG